jgi:ketosteroid isomerase-like protein
VTTGSVTRVDDLESSLRTAERQLQAAQLAGDVAELDRLLDDRLVATLMPDPVRVTKAADLEGHRQRRLALSRAVEEELAVVVAGSTGVTWVLMSMAGTFDGAAFETRMLYTRTWHHTPDAGWRVLAAHISPVPPS